MKTSENITQKIRDDGLIVTYRRLEDRNFSIEIKTPSNINKQDILYRFTRSSLFRLQDFSSENILDDSDLNYFGNLFVDLIIKFKYKNINEVKKKFTEEFNIEFDENSGEYDLTTYKENSEEHDLTTYKENFNNSIFKKFFNFLKINLY